MQAPFDKIEGVVETAVGFSGGRTENPTYKDVVKNDTGHYEVLHVVYDDDVVSYEELLDAFWVNVDPYDDEGQFCDRGESYRTAIFYHSEEQRRVAEASLEETNEVHEEDIVTPILAFDAFYRAEEYHQEYYIKNARRYRFYRRTCGRDRRLNALWNR